MFEYVLFALLRDREATLIIHRDEKAEEHYLSLSELGRVLQELRRSGGYVPQPQGGDQFR